MEGSFEISIDSASRVAMTKAIGMWSHATVDCWQRAFDKMLKGHPHSSGLRIFVDLRRSATHPYDVGARLETITGSYSHRFVKVAIILPSSALAAMQTRRLDSGDHRASARERHFAADEFVAAQNWLNV